MLVDVSANRNSTQGTFPKNFLNGAKINIPIRWTVKHIISGYSDNYVNDSLDTFTSLAS